MADKSKDKSSSIDDGAAPSSAPEAAPVAQLNIHQWCQVAGMPPHRAMAFVRSQPSNEQGISKPADQWEAAFKAFQQTPTT